MKIRVRKRNLKRWIGLDVDWALRLKIIEKRIRYGDASVGGRRRSRCGLKNGENGYGEEKERRGHGGGGRRGLGW